MSRKPQRKEQYWLIVQCLNHLDTLEKEQLRKQSLKAATRIFIKTGKRQQLFALTQGQQSFVIMLVDAYASYKQAFQEAKQHKQYQVLVDPKFGIVKQLLSMQQSLKFKSLTLTTEEMHTKYMLKLLQLKKKYNFQTQFLTLWAALAKNKLKNLQNKRLASKKIIRLFTKQVSKSALKFQKSQEKNQMLQNKQKNILQKKLKLDKNRLTLMQKYLQGRSIKFNRQKCKEVPESLLSKLNDFMKKAISRIIDIASLINKNSDNLENQLSYFSSQKERINTQGMFYVCPSINIYKLSYQHKLVIYTMLRKQQIQKQDKLQKALQETINQKPKKVNQSIEKYLFKPRHSQLIQIQIFNQRTKEYQNKSNYAPNTLIIKSQHVIYYLESHYYLKNSLLLFNSYQYY